MTDLDLSHLSQDTLAPLVGDSFTFDAAGDTHSMQLTELKPLPAQGAGRAPFSLLFKTTATCAEEQRIFDLQHPDLGLFPVFLVPIGRDAAGCMEFEAVFN